jgi:hypothetical protein
MVNVYNLLLKNKSTITICGPSQSGKTTLVEKLVKNRDQLFEDPISNVYWFSAYAPSNKINGVKYNVGVPGSILRQVEPYSLVVIDDYMKELSNSNELTTLMTKAVHHLPMTLIYITQNMFNKGSDTKTRRMNTSYLIVFKNPHDRAQVDYIGRQMFPRDKSFLSSAYDDATGKHPFSYLLIDCNQETEDEIRVRTNITGIEKPMIVYVPPSMILRA